MTSERRKTSPRTRAAAAGPRASRRGPVRTGRGRRGSVLVVVLALLGALMLLGFLFYTIASQERENARYFTASQKWYSAQLDPDELMDFALEQIIVGPQDDLANSALWGGRYSLLASLVGDDLQPYSGRGVRIIDAGGGTPGLPYADVNENGSLDDGTAGSGTGGQVQVRLDVGGYVTSLPPTNTNAPHWLRNPGTVGFMKPDVGYTYPDINSPFLAYVGTEPVSGKRVVIPSFHRPQYLRGLFTKAPAGAAGDIVPPANWYADSQTLPYVLRPHSARTARVFNYSSGNIQDTGVARFTDPALTTSANLSEGFWSWDGSLAAGGTPNVQDALDADPDGDGVKEAMWMDLDHPVEETPDGTSTFIPLFAVTIYDLDGLLNLNAHGDLAGLPDAGLGSLPTGLFQFLSKSNEGRHRPETNPQWGFLDDGTNALPGAPDTTQHQRFFGHVPQTATELANMEWWFTLVGRGELDTNGKSTQLYPGRWGEGSMLADALTAGSLNQYDYPRPGQTGSDEAAGVADGNRGLAFVDVVGQLFSNTQTYSVIFPAPQTPEDHWGMGTFVGGDGRTPLVVAFANALSPPTPGRVKALGYASYWLPAGTDPLAFPLWSVAQQVQGYAPAIVTWASSGLRTITPYYSGNPPGFDVGRLIDNPGETQLDPEMARDQVTDSIFGPDETAWLHTDDAAIKSNGIVSRLLNLVPGNFHVDNSSTIPNTTITALDRRRRFTTVSSDLKSYSYPDPTGTARSWEVSAVNANATSLPTFPQMLFPLDTTTGLPQATEPFRPEARAMLGSQPNMNANTNVRPNLKELSRKLSVNQVAAAYMGRDGQPRYLLRPVTPHPTSGLPATALPVPVVTNLQGTTLAVGTARPYFGFDDRYLAGSNLATTAIATPPSGFTAPQIQEWHARRDRQNLARDIYVLLYTLGHPNPAVNPLTTSAAYSPQQLREMAQFAVNLVDEMDPDDTITAFVFDTNLADGYTYYDDAYQGILNDTDPATDADLDGDPANDFYDTTAPNARGIVYGIESQKLAFSEALAVFAHKFKIPGTNHDATEWSDVKHRDFAYVELQNMSPWTVAMNGGWSIVCEPSYIPTDPPGATQPIRRSLTIVNGGSVPGGGTYTIGTAGDAQNIDPNTAKPRPSYMMVDPNVGTSSGATMNPNYLMIAPAIGAPAGPLNFDGITAASGAVRVNDYDPSKPWKDGSSIVDDIYDQQPSFQVPAGMWLDLGTQLSRDGVTGSETVMFRLRRRANLNRAIPPQDGSDAAQQQDNPWIEVDAIQVQLKNFDLTPNNGNTTQVQDRLANAIISKKRPEPLQRSQVIEAPGVDPPANSRNVSDYQTNSLGGTHPRDISSPAQLWQHHFDRSFASLADVLAVPLYGPKSVTADFMFAGSAAVGDKRAVAAARFLFPENPAGVDPRTPPVFAAGNLWYRLFEFLEVPQKDGDNDGLPWFANYGGPAAWLSDAGRREPWLRERLRLRDFGKLNLNTMRHPQALAGLLDDPRVFGLSANGRSLPTNAGGANEQWANVNFGPSRDWWGTMLLSRDGGLDPYSNLVLSQKVILPGVPSAVPFRGMGGGPLAGGAAAIRNDFEQSILRTMPDEVLTNPGRRSLFELGQTTGSQLGSNDDISARYRLLGKVLNHGTTRSNTYVAFIQVDFFDTGAAIDHDGSNATPSVFQIGSKRTDSPGYRGVFVIDRSLALELLRRRDLPPVDQGLQYPQNSVYRTYSFAREPGPDQRPKPTFDWKKLILSRRIIAQ